MDNPDDIHVTPVNDVADHDERRNCWCKPVFEAAGDVTVSEDYPGPVVVIHGAVDGRE